MTHRRFGIEKTYRPISYFLVKDELHRVWIRRLLHLPNRKAHHGTPQVGIIPICNPQSQR
jgi:hypothetical protein